MPHYSEKRENPERPSDVVRKWENKHPIRTGESVSQGPETFDPNGPGGEVTEKSEAGNPEGAY